jgi:hypothetical protein
MKQPDTNQGPTPGQSRRLSRRQLAGLADRIGPPDWAVLGLLHDHRFLTGWHITGLAHHNAATPAAGQRATQRQMTGLEQAGLVARLPRLVGGTGGGSRRTIWHLTESGQRLLLAQTSPNNPRDPRHRPTEPSPTFLNHTLRVADIRLILEQLDQGSGGTITLDRVQTEPHCWRRWTGPYGAPLTLRPDLYAETGHGDYADLWFIEADLGTEHLPAITRKAKTYQAYHHTGHEQTNNGAFPLVLWATPDQHRADAITMAINNEPGCDQRIHRAIPFEHLSDYLTQSDRYTSNDERGAI